MTRNPWNQLIAEGAGTFLFFFVGAGSAALADFTGAAGGPSGPGLVTIALAHGLVLAVLVSALGAVSGAHFNPAVTFAVWLTGRIESRHALSYVLAQLIGALAAGLALRAVFTAEQSRTLGTPALAQGISPAAGIGIEIVLTVVLLVAVFGTAIDPRGPKVGGLAIGFAVGADILMGGPLTGAAMNPARWFGPAVATSQYGDWYVWIIGPLVGAAIAAAAYRYLLLPEADPLRTPARPETDIE